MLPTENMPPPILITGCARSGTSMVAGAIKICGAFGGNMLSVNGDGEKSMFENAKIRDKIVKPFLSGVGADSFGQFPLPRITGLPIPSDWKQRVQQAMIDDGYTGGAWFYKCPKANLMWPVWNYAFPDAKWIVVRRRSGDIVTSCLKTAFMRAFRAVNVQREVGVRTEEEGWLWWIHQHEKRFVEMINEGLNVKIIWPNRLVLGDYQQLMETIEWLGLSWKSEVLSFIDPKLWKARRK